MPTPIRIQKPIDSLRELELYLEGKDLTLATNLEVDARELLELSTPNWKEPVVGTLLLFVDQDIVRDPGSDTMKKIAPIKGRPPVLSKFLAGMCSPWSFDTNEEIPKDQIVFVKHRKVAQAA